VLILDQRNAMYISVIFFLAGNANVRRLGTESY